METVTRRTQILHCPHCGGRGELTKRYSAKTRGYNVFVECVECGAQGTPFLWLDIHETFKWDSDACNEAVGAWNRRATPQEIEAATGEPQQGDI